MGGFIVFQLFEHLLIITINLIFAGALVTILRPSRKTIALIILTIANTILYNTQTYMMMPMWIYMLIAISVNLVVLMLSVKTHIFRMLMAISFVLISTIMSEVIVHLGYELIGDGGYIRVGTDVSVILKVVFIPVNLLLLTVVVVLWQLFIERLSLRHLQLFILIPISQLIALAILLIYSLVFQPLIGFVLIIVLFLFFLAADIGMFYAMRKIRTKEILRERNELLTRQLHLQLEHYQNLAEKADYIRKLRHDMVNHIQTIQSILSQHQVAAASDQLRKYAEELRNTKSFYYCKNRVVDALLINKAQVANVHEIDLQINVRLVEESVFDHLDLCSVFANMLDNAIDACKRISDPQIAKQIQVDCYNKADYLVIRCRNTKQHQLQISKQGRIMSDKADAKEHGFGLAILEDIARKYGGECMIEAGEEYFQITVYLLQS